MARHRKRNGGGGRLPLYRAYVFKTKDPAINEFRTLVEDHFGHRVNGRDLAQIEADGGPSTGCMRGWFFRDVRRPQNPTLEAAGRAIGYKRVWRRIGQNEPG